LRQITIDFGIQTYPLFAGYVGEHNATELIAIKPADMSGAMYSLAFMTNGEVIHSKYFSADEEIKIELWQQLTQDNTLYVQLEAYDENGEYLAKTAMVKLMLSNSVHGTDVIADADNADIYSEIAQNSVFREMLEDNADTLDKLTTSESGKLLFNGNLIEGTGGGSATLDIDVKTDTEDEYVLEITTDTETITTPNLKGTDGKSGVYVGSGDMPEGYNVQIDPNGEASSVIKVAEQPAFVKSIDEMTDTNKAYVLLPEGYIYAYMKADAQALTASDLVAAEVQADGSLPPDVGGGGSRIATKNLLSLSDKISVSCPAPYQYFVYYYTGETEDTFIGKTAWKSGNIDDVSIDVVASGTNEGAKYCRISLRDSTNTSVDLRNRIVEFAENIKIMQKSATGKAWVNTGLAYNQPADYEDRIVALEKALGGIVYGTY
jgi:hypothetical protein